MAYKAIDKKQMTHVVAGGLLLLGMSSSGVHANSVMSTDSLNNNPFAKAIKNSGIEFGGWVQGGATFNPSQTHGFMGPVTFADQANRFQLNQLNFFIQRGVKQKVKVGILVSGLISCSVPMLFLPKLTVIPLLM